MGQFHLLEVGVRDLEEPTFAMIEVVMGVIRAPLGYEDSGRDSYGGGCLTAEDRTTLRL